MSRKPYFILSHCNTIFSSSDPRIDSNSVESESKYVKLCKSHNVSVACTFFYLSCYFVLFCFFTAFRVLACWQDMTCRLYFICLYLLYIFVPIFTLSQVFSQQHSVIPLTSLVQQPCSHCPRHAHSPIL